MRRMSFILVTLLALSCSPRVITVPIRDTLTVTRTEILHDTIVEMQLPDESVSAMTKDTVSHVETTYAESDAVISQGVLHHTISNKDVPVKARIVYKDRVVTEYRTREVPVPVEVPKPYTPKWVWWTLGWAVLCTVAIGLNIYLKCGKLRL